MVKMRLVSGPQELCPVLHGKVAYLGDKHGGPGALGSLAVLFLSSATSWTSKSHERSWMFELPFELAWFELDSVSHHQIGTHRPANHSASI